MAKRSINLKHYFLKEINFVIKILIVSDVVLLGAASLMGPIFALYVENFIVGGNAAAVAGISAAIYLLVKSLAQIPIAAFIDKVRGEKDDFYMLIVFSVVMSLIQLLYLVVHTPLQLYAMQFVLGLFTAFTFPSYMAIFTRHIDKDREGTEWGVYFTLSDLSSAALAAIGGYIAATEGFGLLIIIMVVLSVIGSLMLWPIKPYLKTKRVSANHL